MIRLKPVLEIPAPECPNCHFSLTAKGFLITGMRNLADFLCLNCGGEFYGDLPAGQALFSPILLNKKSGAVFDNYHAAWFSDWLANAYKQRKDAPLRFEIRKFSQIKGKVILLNCLDALYGHSLLKLLNAQYYLDRQPDFSLIVIVPPFLEWMLPVGIAEAWVIDLPLRRGTEWNDWLAKEINERLKSFSEVFLSVAFSHPHYEDFDIERFTRVAPFALENFEEFQNEPVITFIRREDRLWESENNTKPASFGKLKRSLGFTENRLKEQTRKIIRFAESLRGEFPRLDFAVAGLGKETEFPAWMTDLRLTKLNAETERRWCERYAASHVVLGVHGSNMLLPSAHAGSVIELLDEDRQRNFIQDILFRRSDAREMFFRYRFVPPSTAPEMLAQMVSTMLRYKDFRRLMSPEFCRHREQYDLENWLAKKRDQ
ncbi:MAG: hypothetical protein ABJA66_14910 [Actinomycetota bacterium]